MSPASLRVLLAPAPDGRVRQGHGAETTFGPHPLGGLLTLLWERRYEGPPGGGGPGQRDTL